MSAAERVSQASSVEQANERVERAIERIDERVARYSMRLFLHHPAHRALSSPAASSEKKEEFLLTMELASE